MLYVGFRNYELARLRKIAALRKPGTVLDIAYAEFPNPYFKDLHRTGVDLPPSKGPTRYEEELIGDATNLDATLGSRKFDNVVAGEFIEHIERPYDFLRSLKSFLKPDGSLIISTPNPVAWPCLFFEWFRSKKFYYTKNHAYYFPPRWVERMLTDSGYRVSTVAGVGFLMPGVTIPCPAGLSYQVIFVAQPETTN